MATQVATTTKSSEPDKVDAYMKTLAHPLADVVGALRKIILGAGPGIGEEIKWNAPTFFYTGAMKPSDPKKYERYFVVFNLFKKDCVRLVFWNGARVDDGSGFLEGDYADGRRLVLFFGMTDVAAKKKALLKTLNLQLKTLDR
jgi:hypothetical protein